MSVYYGIIIVVLNIIISAVLLIDVKLELVSPFYIKSGILTKKISGLCTLFHLLYYYL